MPCIPEDDIDYRRLIEIRAKFFGVLARKFPDVRLWVLGYDPGFQFFDCSGRPLEMLSVIRFIVDSLESLTPTIRASVPEAVVIAHFLGRRDIPIRIGGVEVQPQWVFEGILKEIDRRGGVVSDFFDFSATVLDPSLLNDREEEISTPVPVPTQARLRSRRISFRAATGWKVKFLEEFSTNTSNLVSSYSDWNNWRTPGRLATVPVSAGKAKLRLSGMPPQEPDKEIAGAISHPNTDIVPDQEFGSSTLERNKWTAVQDYLPVEEPDASGAHAAVFVRVRDRNWHDLGSPSAGCEDQTRFGAIAYGGPRTEGVCSNEACGALQFTGDDPATSGSNLQSNLKLVNFDLSELPADYPTHTYRVQIIERESFVFGWELRWRAEVWDLTDNERIGASRWVTEWTVENNYDIAIPSLGSSKLGWGWGPGFDGDDGIDVERVGTSYWDY